MSKKSLPHLRTLTASSISHAMANNIRTEFANIAVTIDHEYDDGWIRAHWDNALRAYRWYNYANSTKAKRASKIHAKSYLKLIKPNLSKNDIHNALVRYINNFNKIQHNWGIDRTERAWIYQAYTTLVALTTFDKNTADVLYAYMAQF